MYRHGIARKLPFKFQGLCTAGLAFVWEQDRGCLGAGEGACVGADMTDMTDMTNMTVPAPPPLSAELRVLPPPPQCMTAIQDRSRLAVLEGECDLCMFLCHFEDQPSQFSYFFVGF